MVCIYAYVVWFVGQVLFVNVVKLFAVVPCMALCLPKSQLKADPAHGVAAHRGLLGLQPEEGWPQMQSNQQVNVLPHLP